MAKAKTEGGGGTERARRAPPKRSGPIRATMAGDGSADDEGATLVDGSLREVPELVAETVRLGYRVIEENLRQGRTAAERIRARDYDLGDARDDVATLGRRFLDLAYDLGTSWFDLIGAVVDDPRLRDALRPQPGEPQPRKRPADGAPPAQGTAVKVVGHRGAHGQAQLADLSSLRQPPQVTPLRPVNGPPGAAAIMGARLGAANETGALAVIVPVPADQPPGTYAGTIHESGSNRLLGSVSLTVP